MWRGGHEDQVPVRIGGQANLVASDLREWFADQWRGRTLARTVLVLTVGGVLVFRFVAHPVEPQAPDAPNPGGG